MRLQCGAPEPLALQHRLDDFDCGEAVLDDWLKRRAKSTQLDGSSRTFVVADRQHCVLAYYTIAAGAVAQSLTTAAVRHEATAAAPVLVVARLAVDRRAQGQSLGAALLQDAVGRAAAVADDAGVRSILVRAINDSAKRFYEHFGFQVSPLHPMTLMVRLNSLKR